MSYMTGDVRSRADYERRQTETKSTSDRVENGKNTKRTDPGKTIGTPQLSEKAASYYQELKKKYSDMEFILVSEDQKEQAKAQAGSYANANKMVVLIDEAKVERMAEDEAYRKQYEGIIANAASGMSQLSDSLKTSGASVKGFGMQVNDDGTASYFAVLDKMNDAQKNRMEKAAEKKKAQKKAQKKAEQKRAEKKEKEEKIKQDQQEEVITASSMEDLIRKIQDWVQVKKSDAVQTEEEKKLGRSFDYSI